MVGKSRAMERVEDIPLLTEHVLKSLNSEHKKYVQGISKETINLLQGYAWPGNVRELQNVIERAFFLTDAEEITPLDLPAHLTRQETPVLPVDTQLPFPQAKRPILSPLSGSTWQNSCWTVGVTCPGRSNAHRYTVRPFSAC